LADQIGRAATSVALNLAEGNERTAGDKRRFFEIAHGSAAEVRAAIAVGVAWGWIDQPDELLATLDRMMALLWRLCRGRHNPHYAESRIMPSPAPVPVEERSQDSA
jgi:four helix bundle protein